MAPKQSASLLSSALGYRTPLILLLLALNVCLSIWGLIQSFVMSYAVGKPYGNHYTGIWINAFCWVLSVQAVSVLLKPALTTKRPARLYAWCWYLVWMTSCAIILLVGMHYREMTGQFAWTFLWLPPLAVLAAAVISHHCSHLSAAKNILVDVEAHPAESSVPRESQPCSKAAWCQCWGSYWAFVGWSSLFWLSVLGFFLALQAAWLVRDQAAYPPPGSLYEIDLQDGSGIRPHIHMLCKGPATSGLSTFIMEAGGGSPGISYAAIVDELAASGRRACWYDRLGYGWSDTAPLYATSSQEPDVLHKTLLAAGEVGPFIIAGHSAGGQIAQVFAGLHPTLVSGIALLDAYNDLAIALQYSGSSKNETVVLPSGRQIERPQLNTMNAALQSITDALRAITPFGWARFITMKQDGMPYRSQINAAYGNNKEWQAQYAAVASAVRGGLMPSPDLLTDLAYNTSGGASVRLWHGVGWPNLSPRPVLLLPAESTLRPSMPAGCDVSQLPQDAVCQSKVAACLDRVCTYANLYVNYLSTLSSNISMKVMPGNHAFVTASFKETAAELLQTFAGV